MYIHPLYLHEDVHVILYFYYLQEWLCYIACYSPQVLTHLYDSTPLQCPDTDTPSNLMMSFMPLYRPLMEEEVFYLHHYEAWTSLKIMDEWLFLQVGMLPAFKLEMWLCAQAKSHFSSTIVPSSSLNILTCLHITQPWLWYIYITNCGTRTFQVVPTISHHMIHSINLSPTSHICLTTWDTYVQ